MARDFGDVRSMTFDVVGTPMDFEGGLVACLGTLDDTDTEKPERFTEPDCHLTAMGAPVGAVATGPAISRNA